MMSTIFEIANAMAFLMWLGLVLLPEKALTIKIAKYGIITLLAIAYILLIGPVLGDFRMDTFMSLENIKLLFQADHSLMAGWLHYLAFDMFVGVYIVEVGQRVGLKRWQYTVCLPFTFMFGPFGLLLFYMFRLAKVKSVSNPV
jgi:hypothetical protein